VEEAVGELGDAFEEAGFGLGEFLAGFEFFVEGGGEGGAADFGELGGDFEFPGGGVEGLGKGAGELAAELGLAEGLGIEDAEDVGEGLDGAVEGAFEEGFLGGDEAVLGEGGVEGLGEVVGGAGFDEEAEDAGVVDGVDGVAHVGVAGDHHADAVGLELADLAEELDAVDAGHFEVGEDDGEGAVAQGGEGEVGAFGGEDVVTVAEVALVGAEDEGFVVDGEDGFLGGHRE